MNSKSSVNPSSINPQWKHKCIVDNNKHIRIGNYKNVLNYGITTRSKFNENYEIPIKMPECDVMVIHMNHLDILRTLSPTGLEAIKSKAQYPVIMQPVHSSFDGKMFTHDNGLYNESLALKTDYYTVIHTNYKQLPLRDPEYVLYTQQINVIRDPEYNYLSYDNVYRTGVITASTTMDKDTIDVDGIECMTTSDYITISKVYENVFQTAISAHHNSVIIPMLSQEFNVPVNDQIRIINTCILKYSHCFKAIIISIPVYYDKMYYEYFNEHIIKVQDVVDGVEEEVKGAIHMGEFIPDPDEVEKRRIQEIQKINSMSVDDKKKLIKEKIKEKRHKNRKHRKHRKH
jgi:hypothetical protein